MLRFVMMLALMLVPTKIYAETIRAARILSTKEIEELPEKLEPRLTSITKKQQQAIKAVLDQESVESPRDVLRELSSKAMGEIPVMALTLVLGDLPIAKSLRTMLIRLFDLLRMSTF